MFTPRAALVAAATLTLAAVAARGQQATTPPPAAPAAAAPAKAPGDAHAEAVLATSCVGCHDLGMLTARPHRADEWPVILQQMVANGANLSDDDLKLLQAYLMKAYSAG